MIKEIMDDISDTPSRVMLNFDLDQNILKDVYPGSSPSHAYKIIEKHLLKHGFEHVQGSGYISKQPLFNDDVSFLEYELIAKNLWLADCIKALSSTKVTTRTDRMNELNSIKEDIIRQQTKSKNINKPR